MIRSRSGPLQFHLPQLDETGRRRPTTRMMSSSLNTRDLMTDEEVKHLERRNLLAVLEKANWKISGVGGAAEFLGVHPATLSSRMRTMGIKRPR